MLFTIAIAQIEMLAISFEIWNLIFFRRGKPLHYETILCYPIDIKVHFTDFDARGHAIAFFSFFFFL